MLAGETLEREKLEECLEQVQRKIRCVHRAVYVMTVLTALALAGLCYAAVFLPQFPESMVQFLMQFVVKVCCALAMASLMCLLTFSVLEFRYRRELEQHREARRQCIIGTSSVAPPPAVALLQSSPVIASAKVKVSADQGLAGSTAHLSV
jgi:hypothetical protein